MNENKFAANKNLKQGSDQNNPHKQAKSSEIVEQRKSKNELPHNSKYENKIIKYHNTKEFTFSTESVVPVNEPLFEALPPVIFFSDYEALRVKTVIFKLRNKDSVSRRVRIIQPETNLFKIGLLDDSETESGIREIEKKIAPGLEITFQIKFAPETKKDYFHNLVIVTEREEFIVPIYAVAQKALLEFPDSINFGTKAPVKYTSEKAVILHNRGEKTCKWEIKMPENFSVSVSEGCLEADSTQQILVRFFPIKNKAYKSYGRLIYDEEEAEFELTGTAISGEVHLSQNRIVVEETYISLENKQTFKILNRSSVKIDFEWRSFRSENEEQDKKNTILNQLVAEEEEQRRVINEMIDLEDNIENLEDGPFSNDQHHAKSLNDLTDNEKALVAKKRKKAELILERKYKAIRKEIEEDSLLFEDDIFSIQPLNGSIWPNSEITITVIFKPKSALKYTNISYCNISCSDERLVLHLEGEGLGPKAFLSTNVLSIGDIFVNDVQNFNIYIENRGEIPAKFSLIKNDYREGEQVVKFETESGVLTVGQRVNILVTFKNKRIGEYQEVFRWRLEGSTDQMVLLVRGLVRTPKFEIDQEMIDFKRISFQFEETSALILTNTSSVPFKFIFRIPLDGRGTSKEFEIVPNADFIQPNESRQIVIKFVPLSRKVYNLSLVMDMEGIGRDMKSIPIKAEVEVPKVRLVNNVLDFGEIFLRYTQTKEIELINESKLYARFIIHPINQKYNIFGKVETDIEQGKIPPESSVKINVSLTTSCLKEFIIELSVEIISDVSDVQDVKIKGYSKGPTVDISPKEIDFGDKEVLQKHVKKVSLTNNSIIEADFYAFTKSKTSIFKPLQRHYVLKAGETYEVEVQCLPDDAQKFTDTLFFVIKEGVDKEVKLKARGVGSTIVCKDLSKIDFGTLFTHKNQIEEVFIENKGRKIQSLKWIRKEDGKKRPAENVESAGSLTNLSKNDSQNVYNIYPDSIELPPKNGVYFQFKAFSTDVGNIQEQFTLTTMAAGERKPSSLFNSIFEGSFIKPSISFSKKTLNFQYIWQQGVEVIPISQEVDIVATCPLTVSFSLFIEGPFTVTPENLTLEANCNATIVIEFDPRKKEDLVSGHISEKLWVKFIKHPKNDSFVVNAEFCYPNVSFDKSVINFGAVMNDTIKRVNLNMTNPSLMPIEYTWFLTEDREQSSQSEPLNEIFDILPLRGIVEPGQVENIEFSYFALSNTKFEVNALCRVVGGPEYSLKLNGEASNVSYSLSFGKKVKVIDIGDAFLGQKTTHDFDIENVSKVTFDYSIRIDFSIKKAKLMTEFITFTPSKGTLSGGEKVKIKLSIAPGFPGNMHQVLIIQIAHFEPEVVSIKGSGIFPSIRLYALRKVDSELINIYKLAWENYENERINKSIDLEPWKDIIRENVLYWRDSTSDQICEESEINIKEICNEMHVRIEGVLIKNYIQSSSERVTSGVIKTSHEGVVSKKTISMNSISEKETGNKIRSFRGGDYRFFEELVMGTFSMNLGLIIAGNKSTATFKIENVGKCAINFGVELKNYKNQGISFSVIKVHKLGNEKNNNTVIITVQFQTKKNQKTGKSLFSIPIVVENGGKYILDIMAVVTIPELQISSSEINFGKILNGFCKKSYLRLENTKEISCEWNVTVPVKPRKKKDENNNSKFILSNYNGVIEPGQTKTLEIIFEPSDSKPVEEILTFTFKDSSKRMDVVCKGEGVWPQVEFLPSNLTFPPCLPLETLFQKVQIINKTDFELGFVCSEKDSDIEETIDILSNLTNQVNRLRPITVLEPFWTDLKKEHCRQAALKELEDKLNSLLLQSPRNQQKIEEVQNEISSIKSNVTVIIPMIPREDQYHLLIVNRSINQLDASVANYISKITQKGVVSLKSLLNWAVELNFDWAIELDNTLRDKRSQLQELLADRQKKAKAKKPLPEFNEGSFLHIDPVTFKSLLTTRLEASDCNAGAIFVDLESELLDSVSIVNILNEVIGHDRMSIYLLLDSDKLIENVETIVPVNQEEVEECKSRNLNKFKNKLIRGNTVTLQNELETNIDETLTSPFINEDHPGALLIDDIISTFPSNNISQVPVVLDTACVIQTILKTVPLPKFPNIEKQSIPSSSLFQIVRKLTMSREKGKSGLFQVLTPIEEQHDLEEGLQICEENYLQFYTKERSRWILPPKSSIELLVKFTNDQICTFQENFTIDCFSSFAAGIVKPFTLPLSAVTCYPNVSRNITNVFPNRKKTRVKENQSNNEYIISEGIFDFGPLLVLPTTMNKKQNLIQKRFTTNIRLTNNSSYFDKIIICLLSEQIEIGNEFENTSVKPKSPFDVFPRELEIEIGQTTDITLSCYPIDQGSFHDTLVIFIKDNPSPYLIPLSAEGIYPEVSIDSKEITLDRVLIGKKVMSNFNIINTSLIETNWKLVNLPELEASGFKFSKVRGVLGIGQSENVEVVFSTNIQEKKKTTVEIEVEDNKNYGVSMPKRAYLTINTESFLIKVNFVDFKSNDTMSINFGNTLVDFGLETSFGFRNDGIYPISYDLEVMNRQFDSLFEISPKKGTLAVAGQALINIKFLSKKEIKIDSKSKDNVLKLKIFEKEEILNEIPIRLFAEAQYTKYSFEPGKCLNFGPVSFLETKVKTFEIFNNGLFEFFFEFYDMNNAASISEIKKRFEGMKEDHQSQIVKNKGRFLVYKPTKVKTIEKLTVGQFTITPASGIIAPDTSLKFEVVFKGQGSQFFESKIGIETTNRNPNDLSSINYSLQSESCVPILETKNFRMIFEEQVVTQSLLSTGVNLQSIVSGNIYSIDDKAFYFGSVIPSKDSPGVCEKIKIINISKVPAVVKFEIQKKNGLFAFEVTPSTAKINPHEFVYAKITFKPDIMAQYEGLFKAVIENSDSTTSGSTFSFDLKGEGTLPSINICNSEGQTILPTGEILLNLGKVAIGKKKKCFLDLKNIGIIPAAYKAFWSTPSQVYSFVSMSERSILPSETYRFEIEVEGKTEGTFDSKLIFTTFNNVFEKNIILLRSEIIDELVSIEGLNPENQNLLFGDIIIPDDDQSPISDKKEKLVKRYFTIKNNTNNTLRMQIKKPDELLGFEIRPMVAHIPAKMTKKISIYLIRPKKATPVNYNKDIVLQFSHMSIKVKSAMLQKLINWDDQKFIRKNVSEEEASWINNCNELRRKFNEDKKTNPKTKDVVLPPKPVIFGKPTIEIRELIEEPEYDALSNPPFEQKIQVIGKVDTAKISFDCRNFVFKPTNIMSSRVTNLKMTNNSILSIPVAFDILDSSMKSVENSPFEITPNNCTIESGQSMDLVIRFSPKVFDKVIKRTLVCRINSNNVLKTFSFDLEGEVERPICHFELPFNISDNGERVVEIEAIGINSKLSKKFYVFNPTPNGYEFIWSSQTNSNASGGVSQYLKCLTPKGIILPNKKFEMHFEFKSDNNTPDKQDSGFIFVIKQNNLTQNFLFKTIIVQPKVFLSTPKIDFGPLLLNGKGKEIVLLKNLDPIPYSFAFTKASIKEIGKDSQSSLKVSQVHGVIPAKKEINIELLFNPKLEKDFNYNLQIAIPQKKDNLSLNVKGQGYKLHHSVKVNNCHVESSAVFPIAFGELFIHESRKVSIEISNIGDFNIDFLISKKPHAAIVISPENGTVRKGETIPLDVVFQSSSSISLKTNFNLQIVSGPSYQFEITAMSKTPLVEFSPKSLDFGELTLEQASVSKTIILEFLNYDNKTLSIEYELGKNDIVDVQIPFGQSLLPYEDNKENKLRIPVVFKPKTEERFASTLVFFINSRHRIEIPIKGESITNLFELVNPQDSIVDFGVGSIGQKITKSIAIKNFSKNTIELDLTVYNQINSLATNNIVLPKSMISINKKSTCVVEFTFSPIQRLRQFSVPIKVQVVGFNNISELCSVSGACFAEEIKVLDDNVNFGSVVISSYLTKKIQIVNTGDLASEYKWEVSPNFASLFNISPLSGVIMPSEQFYADVTFSPKTPTDYKIKAKFVINGQARAIGVTFTGKGIQTPNSNIEFVTFETPVRLKMIKNVQIKNTSQNIWKIKPTISTDDPNIAEYFSTNKGMDVAPNETCQIPISYLPFTMLPNPQNGLVFIPLPDGSAKSFQIQGKALPPKPEATLNLSFKSKTQFNHSINVINWLNINQRFHIDFELANGDSPLKEGITINNAHIIEIYSKSQQQFKFTINALKKGTFVVNLFFRNKQNKEYLHYILNLNIEDSQVLSILNFNSVVREPKTQIITIANPLKNAVTLTADKVLIDSKEIYVKNKYPIVIPGESEYSIELVYRPLAMIKQQKSSFKILSPELGNFYYDLILSSEKSTVIPIIHFKTSMSNDSFKIFSFRNFLPKALPFQIKIEKMNETGSILAGNPDFFVDSQTINVSNALDVNGSEGLLNIRFEPCTIGNSKAYLTVSNPEAGEFNAYLEGLSTEPLPKGPFKVTSKGYTIDFKNPFFEAKEFTFKFDNPCFTCSTKSPFKLESKKSINLPISYKSGNDGIGGRIIIEMKNQITWVFYLEGSN